MPDFRLGGASRMPRGWTGGAGQKKMGGERPEGSFAAQRRRLLRRAACSAGPDSDARRLAA